VNLEEFLGGNGPEWPNIFKAQGKRRQILFVFSINHPVLGVYVPWSKLGETHPTDIHPPSMVPVGFEFIP
jgi:hypothetical protein